MFLKQKEISPIDSVLRNLFPIDGLFLIGQNEEKNILKIRKRCQIYKIVYIKHCNQEEIIGLF